MMQESGHQQGTHHYQHNNTRRYAIDSVRRSKAYATNGGGRGNKGMGEMVILNHWQEGMVTSWKCRTTA